MAGLTATKASGQWSVTDHSLLATRDSQNRCGIKVVDRNLKDDITIDELGVEIHFVKENVILSPDSHSSEKFMHGIKVLMATKNVVNLAEVIRKGMREKAAQGIWPSKAPLGDRNVVGPDGRKMIEPDTQTAPLIQKVFEWYAAGNHSLKELTRRARNAGLVFSRSGNPVPRATIYQILTNRI